MGAKAKGGKLVLRVYVDDQPGRDVDRVGITKDR
jgi:hypothetical protein